MMHQNVDYLPPGVAIPLAIVAWITYLIVLAVQSSREERAERAYWEAHPNGVMTADTDPALDEYRAEITLLRDYRKSHDSETGVDRA